MGVFEEVPFSALFRVSEVPDIQSHLDGLFSGNGQETPEKDINVTFRASETPIKKTSKMAISGIYVTFLSLPGTSFWAPLHAPRGTLGQFSGFGQSPPVSVAEGPGG